MLRGREDGGEKAKRRRGRRGQRKERNKEAKGTKNRDKVNGRERTGGEGGEWKGRNDKKSRVRREEGGGTKKEGKERIVACKTMTQRSTDASRGPKCWVMLRWSPSTVEQQISITQLEETFSSD